MHRSVLALAALSLAFSVSGCGDAGPTTYPVSGTVTFNGESIEEGHIAFRDPEGQIPSAGGKITGGEFAFQSRPGKMEVSITARREIPGEFASPAPGIKTPVTEQYIPPPYNTATELTKTVTVGENVFHFELSGGQQ